MSTTASRQYDFVDDKNGGIPITASRHDSELDNIITKLNQKVIVSGTAPSSPIDGMIWVDSTNDYIKRYRNSEWIIHGAVHYGSSAPSTTQAGDIWIDSSASELIIKVRNKDDDGWITMIDENSASIVPSGLIAIWSGAISAIPTGWVICDGNNSTPDLTDRFVLHADADSAGTNNVGDSGGAKTHTLTESEMPLHGHPFRMRTSSGGSGDGSGGIMADTGGTVANQSAYTGVPSNTTGQQIGGTGGGGAHTNRDKYYALAYIQKT